MTIPTVRRNQPKSPLTPQELHQYRSITGQLAWPARNIMPQLSYSVSDLQQRTSVATVHDLHHANKVLEWTKRWALVDKQKLKFLPLKGNLSVDMVYSEHDPKNRLRKQEERKAKLGLAAIHDASFAGQHDFGSQGGYIIMLGDAKLYDEPAQTHLIEWHSGKIQRKVASTLASEANAASQAYDRAMWARAICYEIEQGKDSHWEDMCKKIPFCLGTDCKSLYDNIIKPSSTTKEKRVALDLLDVREGIERMGDQIRWVPTDHMLVDSLTKCMNPALLLKYLADYTYSFKYDDVITETKRFAAKQRKEARDKKISDNKAKADTQRKSNTPKRKADDSDDSEEEDQNQVGAVKRHFVGFVFGIDPSYSSSCSKTDNRCVHVPLDQLSTISSSDNHNNNSSSERIKNPGAFERLEFHPSSSLPRVPAR